MRLVRSPWALLFTFALGAAVLVSGCKSNCRQLSEKACDCTTSSTERTACLQVAANKETASGVILTAEDDDRCKALLDDCDCRLVDTPAGKERCGFAVSSDAGQ